MSKVFFVGVDGAEASILNGLKEQRLISSPIVDQLSTVPTNSMDRGWATIFTGKDASFHNGFYWRQEEGTTYLTEKFDSSMYGTPPIWESLQDHNLTVGVVGVPTSFPVKSLNGFFVASGGGGVKLSGTGCFFPEHILPLLCSENYIFDVRFPDYVDKTPVEFVNALLNVETTRWNTSKLLLKKFPETTFFATVFRGVDVIQHFFWDRLDLMISTGRVTDLLDKAIVNYFNVLLGILEEIIEFAKSDLMLIASDHGFTGYKYSIDITQILQKGGFLSVGKVPLKKKVKDFVKKNVSSRNMARLRILQRKYEMGGVWKLTPPPLDWSRSKVIPYSGLNGLFVVDGSSIDSKRDLIKDVCSYLRGIENPIDKKLLFTNVMLREELYQGPYLENSPDILFDVPDGYKIVADVPTSNAVVYKKDIETTSSKFMPGQGHIAFHGKDAVIAVYKSGIIQNCHDIKNIKDLYNIMTGNVHC